jgi:hypothetical protein
MASQTLGNISAAGSISGTDTIVGVQSGPTDVQYTWANGAAYVAGHLGVATATSITFGGTALAHYVEGTWTPTIVGSSSAGTATYVVQVGSYERIGRQITCRFYIQFNTWTGTGPSVSIGGLPLTSAATTNDYGFCNISLYSVAGLPAGSYGMTGVVAPGTSSVVLTSNSNTTSSGFLSAAQIGAAATIAGTIWYHV